MRGYKIFLLWKWYFFSLSFSTNIIYQTHTHTHVHFHLFMYLKHNYEDCDGDMCIITKILQFFSIFFFLNKFNLTFLTPMNVWQTIQIIKINFTSHNSFIWIARTCHRFWKKITEEFFLLSKKVWLYMIPFLIPENTTTWHESKAKNDCIRTSLSDKK